MSLNPLTARKGQNVLLGLWTLALVLSLVWVVMRLDADPVLVTWYMPVMLPIFGALVGARIAEVRRSEQQTSRPEADGGTSRPSRKLDESLFRMTIVLSILHFVFLGWVISDPEHVLLRMRSVGLVIGPLEAILLALLGYIFHFDPKQVPGIGGARKDDEGS